MFQQLLSRKSILCQLQINVKTGQQLLKKEANGGSKKKDPQTEISTTVFGNEIAITTKEKREISQSKHENPVDK